MIEGEQLPTIPGEYVRLRWLVEDDVDALYRIFSDPRVMRYWSRPSLTDEAGAHSLLAEIRDCFRKRHLFQWGLARERDDAVIGTCTLTSFDRESRRAEIGYALAYDSWGQGHMTAGLRALLGYAFDELSLRRIEADVDPRNAPSIRLLERLGFRREGYLRERWEVGGEIQDALFYGLLRSEWR